MNLKQLRNTFLKLKNKLLNKNVTIEFEINSTYGVIIKNLDDDLTNVVNSNFKKSVEKLNKTLLLSKRERNKIINEKIKDKTFKQRINRDKTILVKKVKKESKKEDKEKKKGIISAIKKSFNSSKRIFKTEKHRVTEKTKNYVYEIVNPDDYEKVWKTSFINSRDSHISMHNQVADKNGFFYSPNGYRTKYPGGFGIAKEDIHCKCKIIYKKKKG